MLVCVAAGRADIEASMHKLSFSYTPAIASQNHVCRARRARSTSSHIHRR